MFDWGGECKLFLSSVSAASKFWDSSSWYLLVIYGDVRLHTQLVSCMLTTTTVLKVCMKRIDFKKTVVFFHHPSHLFVQHNLFHGSYPEHNYHQVKMLWWKVVHLFDSPRKQIHNGKENKPLYTILISCGPMCVLSRSRLDESWFVQIWILLFRFIPRELVGVCVMTNGGFYYWHVIPTFWMSRIACKIPSQPMDGLWQMMIFFPCVFAAG